jgi:membrane protease YdiL (CAAX protease family)
MSTQEMTTRNTLKKKENLQKFSWKEFFILVAAGLFGVVASLPTAWSTIMETAANANAPVQLLLGGQIVQSAIWMVLAVGIGLLLSKKTGLGAPILEGYINREAVGAKLRSHILPSISLGVLGAIAAKALDAYFFIPNMPGFSSVISQVSGWKGFLASFYGGITEEILSRLFFLTLLAWILGRFIRSKNQQPSKSAMWIAILASAAIFGLGHLPATLMNNQFSPMILARAIILNGIPGTIFGYLYWKRGLEFSMMAHFSADLVVHVIYPLLSV